MVFQNDIVAGASGAGGGYAIDQSIRFNDDDSAYLYRTFGTATSLTTTTLSLWVKRCNLGTDQYIMVGSTSAYSDTLYFRFTSADILEVLNGPASLYLRTTQVFRDTSAWYHIVFVLDTSNATSSERFRFYVNGERITAVSSSYPSLNQTFKWNSSTGEHSIGCYLPAPGNGFADMYMAEINFIDGQDLAPTDFGEYNSDGVWVPIKYAGTYGTNGFYITGADSADLGADDSGNGNNFTSSGLASDDQMLDTPTDNFATFSPINLDGVTLSNGNLFCASAGYYSGAAATISIPNTGKWYIETLVGNRYGSYQVNGFLPTNYEEITDWSESIRNGAKDVASTPNSGLGFAGNDGQWGFYAASGTTSYTATEPDGSTVYSTNDLYVCHALDLDNERYWVGTAFTTDSSVSWFGPSGIGADPETPSTGLDISAYLATYGDYGFTFFHGPNATSASPSATVDFGQSGYNFTKPEGFNTVSTANLSTPAIADGSAYMQTTLYTGTGSALEINQTGNSTFQPDMVWAKSRSASQSHRLADAIRGSAVLFPDSTAAEDTTAGISFDADGFSWTNSDGSNANDSGVTYAAWQWLAGNGTATNEDGSITSTVSANTTAGFSVISYTGNGTAGATVGHGLGVAPSMLICKNRDGTEQWIVYHSWRGATQYGLLNATTAWTTSSSAWNDTAPTSSVVTLGGGGFGTNVSSNGMIMYAFAEVNGFSKISGYIGNGSTDGPFIYCGFRPAWVIIKATTTKDWPMQDTTRDPYNVASRHLFANQSLGEYNDSNRYADYLSNGFKLRTAHNAVNTSTQEYMFMAFAEHPFGGDGVAPVPAR